MPRRRTPELLAALLLTVGLVACSTEDDRDGRWRDPEPSAGPATPGPVVPAPEVFTGTAPTGAFAVGQRELSLSRGADRPLPVTLWYPATGAAGTPVVRSAEVADGRFPVIVFSHGLGARPADYRALLTRWAAAGFVVAAPLFPYSSRAGRSQGVEGVLDVLNQPADVSYVLTELLGLDGRAGDPLRGRLATDRVAAAGHSAGGVTTVGLFTTGRDERLDAGVVFAGSTLGVGSAFAGAAAPQLFVHGERDDVVAYTAGRAAFDAVPWPKAMLSLPRGDHGPSLLTDGSALRVVADTTIEFLRWSLYGDPAAKRRLPTDAARGGLATLDNRL